MPNWNHAVTLHNIKPITKNYYQYPSEIITYALHTLSYPALRLYLIMAGQADGFTGSMKLYCDRANISIKHYTKYRDELIEKGFLLYEPYTTITIQYPLSGNKSSL
jgi:hypothetical protein